MSRNFPKGRALLFVQAERSGALLLTGWGILSTAIGITGLFYPPLLVVEGMGLPFLLLGAPMLIIGVRHLAWTFRQAQLVEDQPAHLPKHFLQEEWERVDILLAVLQRGRDLSLLFLVLGFSLTLLDNLLDWGPYSLGIGLGVPIQSVFALIYVLFWQFRNGLYQHELEVAGH